MKNLTPEKIDAVLPQTQCGLCGYGGCMPYAKAMLDTNAPINLCPPGGVKTLKKIAELLQQDASPYIAEMEQTAKPAMRAVIREAECIGCTKCIQVCPVDAILGSGKLMHTIIGDECTGCELCVPACPVDCIDMLTLPQPDQEDKSNYYRQRYQARHTRLSKEKNVTLKPLSNSTQAKKNYIQDAIARAKAKKSGG